MIYKKKCELETVPIEGCTDGKGTVKMEKLLCALEGMMGKGRTYVHHTLNLGISIGMHIHGGKIEIMVTISGEVVHAVNGQEQYLKAGDMTTTRLGDTYGIAQEGTEPPALTVQALYAQTGGQRAQREA